MKVKGLPCCKLLDDPWYQPFTGKAKAQSMGIAIALLPIWCTKSTQVGTRKMVNYAWEG